MPNTLPGGSWLLGGQLTVSRMGYGAMQLTGPGVFGPPADREGAVAVLREVIRLGITHIDTSDYYGPHVTNEILREALAPYPGDLHIVTKVGFLRDQNGGGPQASEPGQLRQAVEDNLTRLGLESLDVVNLRLGGPEESVTKPFAVLAELQEQGLVKHLGLSTVTAEQIRQAQTIAPVVCVQNMYNIAQRADDDLVDDLAAQDIAYVPYFPLGGLTPVQSAALDRVAARHSATPKAVALAWLLRRSPHILLIPGTSSIEHLRENVTAATTELSQDDVADLDVVTG